MISHLCKHTLAVNEPAVYHIYHQSFQKCHNEATYRSGHLRLYNPRREECKWTYMKHLALVVAETRFSRSSSPPLRQRASLVSSDSSVKSQSCAHRPEHCIVFIKSDFMNMLMFWTEQGEEPQGEESQERGMGRSHKGRSHKGRSHRRGATGRSYRGRSLRGRSLRGRGHTSVSHLFCWHHWF